MSKNEENTPPPPTPPVPRYIRDSATVIRDFKIVEPSTKIK